MTSKFIILQANEKRKKSKLNFESRYVKNIDLKKKKSYLTKGKATKKKWNLTKAKKKSLKCNASDYHKLIREIASIGVDSR